MNEKLNFTIYLFIIDKSFALDTPKMYQFDTAALFIQDFLYNKHNFKWNRLFLVHPNCAEDRNFPLIREQMKFQQFIVEDNSTLKVTEKGRSFLNAVLESDSEVKNILEDFASNFESDFNQFKKRNGYSTTKSNESYTHNVA